MIMNLVIVSKRCTLKVLRASCLKYVLHLHTILILKMDFLDDEEDEALEEVLEGEAMTEVLILDLPHEVEVMMIMETNLHVALIVIVVVHILTPEPSHRDSDLFLRIIQEATMILTQIMTETRNTKDLNIGMIGMFLK